MQTKHVYISCSLTHVPLSHFTEHVTLIDRLALLLENRYGLAAKHPLRDCDRFLPAYSADEMPRKCYEWDRAMVEGSCLVIAEASFPAVGVGMEVQIAHHADIPVLLLYRDYGDNQAEQKHYSLGDRGMHTLQIGNGIVPLMLQGSPAVLREIRYAAADDALFSVESFMDEFVQHEH